MIALADRYLGQLIVDMVYKFFAVSKTALFAYDFSLTLADEATLVWPKGWAVGQLLFYSVRYSLWPESIAELLFWFGRMDRRTCAILGGYLEFSFALGILLAQGVIVLRTWAVWGTSRAFIIAVSVAAIAGAAGCCYISWAAASGTTYDANVETGGCAIVARYQLSYINMGILCFNDLALIVLTILKYKAISKGESLTLESSLYRDAFAFFAFMLACAVANVLVKALAPSEYRTLLFGGGSTDQAVSFENPLAVENDPPGEKTCMPDGRERSIYSTFLLMDPAMGRYFQLARPTREILVCEHAMGGVISSHRVGVVGWCQCPNQRGR